LSEGRLARLIERPAVLSATAPAGAGEIRYFEGRNMAELFTMLRAVEQRPDSPATLFQAAWGDRPLMVSLDNRARRQLERRHGRQALDVAKHIAARKAAESGIETDELVTVSLDDIY
jgi:hypothetical protein